MKKKTLFLLTLLFCLMILPFSAYAGEGEIDPSALIPAWSCTDKADCKMSVEAGLTITMGRYMYNNFFTKSNAVWKSSNTSVASFTKKKGEGVLKTKKPGTTTITLTYKKKPYTCKLTVKKKGSLIKGKYKNFRKAQNTLLKYRKTKVSKKNFTKIHNAVTSYNKLFDKLMYSNYLENGTVYGKSVIYVPVEDYNLSADLSIALNTYAKKQLKKKFTIKSVSAGTKRGTMIMTLSKKVTADQKKFLDYIAKENDGSLVSFARHVEIYKVSDIEAKLAELKEEGYSEKEAMEEIADDADSDTAYVDFKFTKNSNKVTVSLLNEENYKPYNLPASAMILFDEYSDDITNAKTYFILK